MAHPLAPALYLSGHQGGMKPVDLTIRQRITGILEGGVFSAKDISRAAGVKEKEVLDHLPHIARTVNSRGRKSFVTEPSVCLNCGFVFKKRDRLKTPGKCPVCKSEEITQTRYGIVEETTG